MNKNYKEKLQDCRESIDRLDTILTYTLGERFQKTKEIGKIKAKNNLPSTCLLYTSPSPRDRG